MKNQEQINAILDDLFFELGTDDNTAIGLDRTNPKAVQKFINGIDVDGKSISEKIVINSWIDDIKQLIAEYEQQQHSLSRDELKQIYLWLKDRKLHPKGEFDRAKRFYLKDRELVDVRPPSAKHPFSQMQAGRTSKFVNAMADKYKPQTLQAMLNLFEIDKTQTAESLIAEFKSLTAE